MVTEGYSGPFFSSNSGGYGDGGCGISTLLIFALLAGGGFGGWGRGECGGGYNCGEVSHIDHQFSQIQNDIQSSELVTQMQIDNLGTSLYSQSIFKEICDANRNIDDKAYSTLAAIDNVNYNALANAKDGEIMALQCCCETKEALAAGFNALSQKMDAREIQDLRDKLNDVQFGLSQCRQTGQIEAAILAAVNTVRPYPQPAFAVNNPAQQVFPPTPSIPAAALYGAYAGNCGPCGWN